jgi:hypothetical protein
MLLMLCPSAALAASGSIEALSGAVYFKGKRAESWGVALLGAPVAEGDSIKTGSDGRARISFPDGSIVAVGNESTLTVEEFRVSGRSRRAVYALSGGKLRAIVGAFSGASDIRVRTPTAVAGVKGTDFMVMNEGQANVVFGEEGLVTFGGSPGASVELTPGHMTENTRGERPIAPVGVEPGSALDEARLRLMAVTDVAAPVEWETAGTLPAILSRWNINYGHYLADSRRYADALGVFQIAIDLSAAPGLRAEAHLERGTVYSRNLGEPALALEEYMEVVLRYRVEPFAENAIFSAGMIKMDMGDRDGARGLFRRYMEDYPHGGRTATVELLLRELERD